MNNIKSRISHFQRTGHGLNDLVSDLAIRAYRYALEKADDDTAGDMIVDLLPRLPGMIARYRDSGIPFDHYFNSVICWRLKAQLRRGSVARERWKAAQLVDFWGGAGLRQEPGHGEVPSDLPADLLGLFESWDNGKLTDPVEARRFLLAVLRRVWTLTASQVEEIAAVVDLPVDWLLARVQRLRLSLARRLTRLERLQRRRDTAYARMRLVQERLGQEVDEAVREELRDQAVRYAGIWRKAAATLEHTSLAPTHRQLASELGIPRGTVGTALRWLHLRAGELRTQGRELAG